MLRDLVDLGGRRPQRGPDTTDVSDALPFIVEWLGRAQDADEDGGVSAGYSFREGWLPSYPETTGYTIPTFLDYYHLRGNVEYLTRAVRMADWLVSVQYVDGAVRGLYGGAPAHPTVFNTAQVLQGLVRIYEETGDEKYLAAGRKAADWLAKVQADDGSWRRFTYKERPHTYHTRVAWPLLEAASATGDETYLRAARKCIAWVLGNQQANGWLKNVGFTADPYPPLHTIAYAIEGLMECAALLDDEDCYKAAYQPALVLQARFEETGVLSGTFNSKWEGQATHRCLTGEAQMSVCWLKLGSRDRNKTLIDCAVRLNQSILDLLDFRSRNLGIQAGVKGSHPVWGPYMPFVYPNWAAKFLADALMLEQQIWPTFRGSQS